MKIILINPFLYYIKGAFGGTLHPPMGLLYLAASLEKAGFETRVLDAEIGRIPQEEVLRYISGFKPEMVGITSNIASKRAAVELAQDIKKDFPSMKLIIGGPMPSIRPEAYLPYCDAVVLGEGEDIVVELAEVYSKGTSQRLREIKGICFWEGDKVVNTGRRGFIQDLDRLPFPAYHLLIPGLGQYSRRARTRKTPMASIFTSRGCPYGCVFCDKAVHGFKFRSRSPENVLSEIEWLINKFGVKEIHIGDDLFSMDLPRAKKILDLIIRKRLNIAMILRGGVRVDRVDEELIKKMREAGVYKAAFGVETGDMEVIKNTGKGIDLEQVVRVKNWFDREGIRVHAYFMFGLPGDTPETMQRTIDFAKELDPYVASFNMTLPYPGTKLYDFVKNQGEFVKDPQEGTETGFFGGKAFFSLGPTHAEDVEYFYKKAVKEFYLRPKKILELFIKCRSLGEIQWVIEGIIEVIPALLPSFLFGRTVTISKN
ncbi:MAG: radical SAM protein [Candidatus Brocadiales bacterium]|nr:radical SAM protein [Candidatus Brocadiales bacterium]